MKLVATVKLLPSPDQAKALLATIERCNEACDWLGGEAHRLQVASNFTLHGTHYKLLREKFKLPSQMAVRVLANVCDAYKVDTLVRPRFRQHGAVTYDQRNLTPIGADAFSIQTIDGRITVPFVAGPVQAKLLAGKHGQADLVYKRGKFFLHVSVEAPCAETIKPVGALGVDLGIVNLATDSDGERYSGDAVRAVRERNAALRGDLQARGTKSAKRHLKGLSGKVARFNANTNHVISKKLVVKAKGTGRVIALENLRGIRDRVTVRRSQRSALHGWSFFQLRSFVSYKAQLAGVPVVLVDPRNTSRTCPQCDHCDKRNRRSQSEFRCKSCDYTEHADFVGAVNVSRRAAVNRPIVSSVEAGIPAASSAGYLVELRNKPRPSGRGS